MAATLRFRCVRLGRWILISLAAAVVVGGLAVPAGASGGAYLGAGTLANVVSLGDSGNNSVCAVLSSGKVDCWGANGFGQLGNGTTAESHVPVAVLGLSGVMAVAGDFNGGSFCAVLSTGHLKCRGYNGDGELGNGTTTTFTVPVAVQNISTAAAVFAGADVFCARLSAQHLNCWGAGTSGQLGDGAFASSDVPAAVRDISNATKIITGNAAFCGLLSTSHVDCWGSGSAGQLGDGSTSHSDVPVPVQAAT